MTGYVFSSDAAESDWELEVRTALSGAGDLETVFQPIRGLWSGEVIAVEGLIHSPRVGSGQLFSHASMLGLEVSLETATLGRLLDWFVVLRSPRLSINVTPGALADGAIREMLAPYADRIILEVSERSFLPEPREFAAEIVDLRNLGAELALDNAGAGFGGLRLLLALEPEWVKLDRAVVSGLSGSADRAALAAAFVEISNDVGARAIAVGVEEVDELSALAELGVEAWQGFLDVKSASSVEIPVAKIVNREPSPLETDFVVELGSSLDLVLARWMSRNSGVGTGYVAVQSRGEIVGHMSFDEVVRAHLQGSKLAGLA